MGGDTRGSRPCPEPPCPAQAAPPQQPGAAAGGDRGGEERPLHRHRVHGQGEAGPRGGPGGGQSPAPRSHPALSPPCPSLWGCPCPREPQGCSPALLSCLCPQGLVLGWGGGVLGWGVALSLSVPPGQPSGLPAVAREVGAGRRVPAQVLLVSARGDAGGWGGREDAGMHGYGYGDTGIWGRANMGIWGHRDMGMYGYGDMGMYRHGNTRTWGTGIWGHADMGTQGCGDMGTYGYGDTDMRLYGYGDMGTRCGTWGYGVIQIWGHRDVEMYGYGDTGMWGHDMGHGDCGDTET